MKYSVDWLIDQYNKSAKLEYVFFWGHTGDQPKKTFSQWYTKKPVGIASSAVPLFQENLQSFYNAEQYMMLKKALLFGDVATAKIIAKEADPSQVKGLGRQIKNFDNGIWDANKYEIVKRGNFLKFNQNTHLKDALLSTGNKILVEASPKDQIWGIGLAENDADASIPENWNGLNLLGFALMEVRDELRLNLSL
jgi:ribA/ribD-fused uncharacterized protein